MFNKTSPVIATRVRKRVALPALFSFVLTVFVTLTGMLHEADLFLSDRIVQFSSRQPSGETVIVGIDFQSIQQFGGYPISRDKVALALDKLNQGGARRILLDLTLAAPANAEFDRMLTDSIKRLGAERVALQSFLVAEKSSARLSELLPLESFARHASLVSGDCIRDSDGLVRAVGLPDGKYVTSKANIAEWLSGARCYAAGRTAVDFRINVDAIPVISLVDLLEDRVDCPGSIAGKNIVLGVIAGRITPSLRVPRYRELSRTQFAALAADTLSQGDSPYRFGDVFLLALMTPVMMGMAQVLARSSPWSAASILAGMLSLAFVAVIELYRVSNIQVSMLVPICAVLFTYIGSEVRLRKMFQGLRHALTGLLEKVDYRLAKLFHSGIDSIITFSPDGRILTVNATAERMLGITAGEVIGRSLLEVFPQCAEQMMKTAAGQQPGRLEATLNSAVGKRQHVDLAINSVPVESGWVGYASIRDISEIHAREEALRRQATHDALTGLPNRFAFEQHLAQILQQARQSQESFAVFLLDLNKFKRVNDTLGHQAGDDLLREVARRFQDVLRPLDNVFRLGGDEFAVVISSPTRAEQVQYLAEEMAQAVADIKEVSGHSIETGTSIGIAFYPSHAQATDDLMRAADFAMYQAKRSQIPYFLFGDTILPAAPISIAPSSLTPGAQHVPSVAS